MRDSVRLLYLLTCTCLRINYFNARRYISQGQTQPLIASCTGLQLAQTSTRAACARARTASSGGEGAAGNHEAHWPPLRWRSRRATGADGTAPLRGLTSRMVRRAPARVECARYPPLPSPTPHRHLHGQLYRQLHRFRPAAPSSQGRRRKGGR